jgi:hypothetical protein
VAKSPEDNSMLPPRLIPRTNASTRPRDACSLPVLGGDGGSSIRLPGGVTLGDSGLFLIPLLSDMKTRWSCILDVFLERALPEDVWFRRYACDATGDFRLGSGRIQLRDTQSGRLRSPAAGTYTSASGTLFHACCPIVTPMTEPCCDEAGETHTGSSSTMALASLNTGWQYAHASKLFQ